MTFPTLDELHVGGRTVLVRSDLNVPLTSGGEVADDFRVTASLPTIHELRERGARVVVCSHLGRPSVGGDPDLAMDIVSDRLSELGGFPTIKVDSVAGPEVAGAIAAAGSAVTVLENTRFAEGETSNDQKLVAALADLADVFVLDAFGSSHRVHASTFGVAQSLPSAAGRLLESEVVAFERLLIDPPRPLVVLLGGAKASDKLAVMRHILPHVDLMLVGGGMCFTLLAAAGYQIGESLKEESMMGEAAALLASDEGGKIVLPIDIVVADRFAADSNYSVVPATALPEGKFGLDIGPGTVELFGNVIESGDAVFWNGPMGVFEWEAFRAGTEGVARCVADASAYTVIGGGDSVAAIRMLRLEDQVGHVSTGGGAGLTMLEGRTLPGIEALGA